MYVFLNVLPEILSEVQHRLVGEIVETPSIFGITI